MSHQVIMTKGHLQTVVRYSSQEMAEQVAKMELDSGYWDSVVVELI